MAIHNLKVTFFDKGYSEYFLDGEVSLAKNDAFRVLEKKLLESGKADEHFSNYVKELDPKLWEEPNKIPAELAVDDWFNDNSEQQDHSSAREFYNTILEQDDIEVTIDRDYYVELDGDTFVAHVDYVWTEMWDYGEAQELARENYESGQMYLNHYFSGGADEKFKHAFERATEYTDRYYLDPEKFEEMNEADKAQFEDEMQDIVDDNFVNWTTAQIEIC